MNTKDFDFLLRKEFLILCFLLLALTFTHISAGQQVGISRVEPFQKLNISLFETLGIILPVFTLIFLFFQKRSERTVSLPPSILYGGVAMIICFVIVFFAILGTSVLLQPEEESPVSDDINDTSTNTPTTHQPMEPTQSPSPLDGSNLRDSSFFFQFLMELRILIPIAALFLPLLLLMVIRQKSKLKETEAENNDIIPDDKQEKPYKMRTVLECYYQASTALEERGAESSPSFTPTEFTMDVIAKSLTSPPLIDNLTSLFEEVKFSTHEISDQQVDLAKFLSSKIIVLSDSSLKNELEKEEIE